MTTTRKRPAPSGAASRSGTPWSEEDYRAHGYGSVKIRLPREHIERLDAICRAENWTRAEFLELSIRDYEAQQRAIEARRRKRAGLPP